MASLCPVGQSKVCRPMLSLKCMRSFGSETWQLLFSGAKSSILILWISSPLLMVYRLWYWLSFSVPPASMSDLPRSCNSSTSTLRSLSTQTLREDAATSSSSSPTTNTPVCEEKPPVPEEGPPPSQPTPANTFQEPDVIASTKSSNNNTPIPAPQAMATSNMVPVAPPRRKKKNKAQVPTTLPLATDGSTIPSKKVIFINS